MTEYDPVKTNVSEVITETSNIKTFVLRPERPLDFEAGQFIQLTVPGVGEGPFTPSSSPYEKEKLEVTIMEVGRVTSALHNLKQGSMVGLRGPFGKEYPLDRFRGREILIVGGGVGMAPLRSLFLSLAHTIEDYKKLVFCCGSRTPKDIVYKDAVLDKWQTQFKDKVSFRITVDEGDGTWKGQVGLVTTTLDNLDKEISSFKESIAVVCGPPIMMKFTTLKLLDIGYGHQNIYLSMEKNMSCGLGRCGHCQMGKYLVCRDGPVFTYEEVKNIPNMWD